MSAADDASEFIQLLAAAMADAATEGKATQLQSTITPPGGPTKLVRVIVVPEELEFVRLAPGKPFRRPA